MTSLISKSPWTVSPTTLGMVSLAPVHAALIGALLMLSVGRATVAVAALALALLAILVMTPRLSFYLFILSMCVWMPQRLTATFAVHPFDIMLAVVFAGIALEFLLKSDGQVRSATFDLPFLVLIAATLLSAVLAFRPAYSVVPLVRISVIYLAFRVVFKFACEIGVRRILTYYLAVVTALSAYNLLVFVLQGGRLRVFGPGLLIYETLVMTALPMALAFLLWSSRLREQLIWGLAGFLMAGGIVATQARGPLLTVIIGALALCWFTFHKARRENCRRALRTTLLLVVGMIVVAVVIVSLSAGLLTDTWARYEEFVASAEQPEGTVALRLVLWKTAWSTFLDHPILGIGIGNFRIVHELYPELHIVPLYRWVKGMSAHNVLLHYLAETGLVGTLALLARAFAGLRAGYRTFRARLSAADTQVSVALFVAMVIFAITLLYMRAWTWGEGGYIMALLFGLTAAWYQQTVRRPTGVSTQTLSENS
jgi:O-antigen ligase